MLDRFSVKSRLIMLVGLPLLGFIIISALALSDMRSLNRNSGNIFDYLIDMSLVQQTQDAYAIGVVDTFTRFESGDLTRNQLQRDISRFREQGLQAWQRYRDSELYGDARRLAGQIDTQLEAAERLSDRLLQNAVSQNQNDSNLSVELAQVFDPMTVSLRGLMEVQQTQSQQLYDDIQNRYDRGLTIFVIVVAITLIVSIIFARMIFLSIQRPVDQLGEVMTRVAKESDLKLRAPVVGDNELSLLGRRFNTMMDSFQEVLVSVAKPLSKLLPRRTI